MSWLVEACVFSFVGLSAAAIALYPGGTFWDHDTNGHSFWQNFLCDLIQTPALNGAPNEQGARLATWGMLALVAALVAFVGLVPTLLHEPQRMTRQVKAIALLVCGLTACVPLLPSDRFGALHAAAVFVAGVPVSLALMTLVSTLLRQGALAPWLRVLSISLCIVLAASLVLYAAEVCFDSPPLRIVPTLARLSNVMLVLWLLGLARLARARTATRAGSEALASNVRSIT